MYVMEICYIFLLQGAVQILGIIQEIFLEVVQLNILFFRYIFVFDVSLENGIIFQYYVIIESDYFYKLVFVFNYKVSLGYRCVIYYIVIYLKIIKIFRRFVKCIRSWIDKFY